MTGNAEKSEALIRVIRPYGIKNIARTGATGFYSRLILALTLLTPPLKGK